MFVMVKIIEHIIIRVFVQSFLRRTDNGKFSPGENFAMQSLFPEDFNTKRSLRRAEL